MSDQVTIRPATPSERDEALRQWTSSFSPGNPNVTVGSTQRTLSLRLFKRAHKLLAQTVMAESEVHVIVLSSVPREPLGWVCFTSATNVPGDIHYLYVVEPARRKGLGSLLLNHATAFGAERSSHMTASGRALASVLSPQGAETEVVH